MLKKKIDLFCMESDCESVGGLFTNLYNLSCTFPSTHFSRVSNDPDFIYLIR
jgi:hypothetical protein